MQDDDYSYSDGWKEDDYFKDFKDSWDRQSREITDNAAAAAADSLLPAWSEAGAGATGLIN